MKNYKILPFGIVCALVLFSGCNKESDTDSTQAIDSKKRNYVPVANAGTDQYLSESSVVILNGSSSIDIDSDRLTYKWSILSKPENSNISLSDTSSINPTFISDKIGIYTFGLTVNDGTADSNDTITVNVESINTKRTIYGVAVDGYVKDATVTYNGVTTTTNSDGSWSLTYETNFQDDANTISITGGIDTATGEDFEGILKAPLKEDGTTIVATPLTTIVSSLVEKGMPVDEATKVISKQLDIPEYILKSDPIEILHESDPIKRVDAANAIKKALVIQKATETLAKSVSGTDEKTMEIVMQSVIDEIASSMSDGKSFDNVMKDTSTIATGVALDITNNETISIENISEKLTAGADIAKTVIEFVEKLDIEVLANASDITKEVESKSKAIEVLTSTLEEKVEIIAQITDMKLIETVLDDVSKTTDAITMLGGIDGISLQIDIQDESKEVDASEFADEFLTEDVIEEQANSFKVLRDAGLTDDLIMQIGEEAVVVSSQSNLEDIINEIIEEAIDSGEIEEITTPNIDSIIITVSDITQEESSSSTEEESSSSTEEESSSSTEEESSSSTEEESSSSTEEESSSSAEEETDNSTNTIDLSRLGTVVSTNKRVNLPSKIDPAEKR